MSLYDWNILNFESAAMTLITVPVTWDMLLTQKMNIHYRLENNSSWLGFNNSLLNKPFLNAEIYTQVDLQIM